MTPNQISDLLKKRLKRLSGGFLPLLFMVFSGTIFANNDWPEFRGPTGQGHAEGQGFPVEWSDTQNVTWKRAIPGKGWSSPVVKDQRVFLTTAVPAKASDDISLQAICVDAESGSILWEKEVFLQNPSNATSIHAKNSHASASPVIEGNRVYVHFGYQGTACLDFDGNIIWQNRHLSFDPFHGNGGSPIIVGDNLIFNCDGAKDPFIAALNKENGEIAWKVKRKTDAAKTFSFSTPLLIEVNGRKQVISVGSNEVCALNPETGDEIWWVNYQGYSVVPRPVYGDGLVFISTGFDRPEAWAIRPDGQGEVTKTHVAWKLRRGAPSTPSMLKVGDELYMISDGGIATCMDAQTGKILWNERVVGGCSSSPLYADGRIYFQDELGRSAVVKAGRKFELLAENKLKERVLASYAAVDGVFFIRSEENLFRVEANY